MGKEENTEVTNLKCLLYSESMHANDVSASDRRELAGGTSFAKKLITSARSLCNEYFDLSPQSSRNSGRDVSNYRIQT